MAVTANIGSKTGSFVTSSPLASYASMVEPIAVLDSRFSYGKLRISVDTVTTASDDSATSTYHLARIPSNAIILPTSTIYWDDLASSGSPTLDVGLWATKENWNAITAELSAGYDIEALTTALDTSSAGSASVISDHTNGILPAWDHMASVTVDPGGMLDVKVSVYEHALAVAGQITLCLHYVVE